jgi:hypothetical protein
MKTFSEVTFRQLKSEFIHDALVLRHDRVVIQTGAGDVFDERHVPLDDIAPEIEFSERRFTAAFWVILFFGLIFLAATWAVSNPPHSPLKSVLQLLFGGFAGGSLCAAVISLDRVSVATVKSRSGETLFQMRRESEVAADYEVFLLQLERQLKKRAGG